MANRFQAPGKLLDTNEELKGYLSSFDQQKDLQRIPLFVGAAMAFEQGLSFGRQDRMQVLGMLAVDWLYRWGRYGAFMKFEDEKDGDLIKYLKSLLSAVRKTGYHLLYAVSEGGIDKWTPERVTFLDTAGLTVVVRDPTLGDRGRPEGILREHMEQGRHIAYLDTTIDAEQLKKLHQLIPERLYTCMLRSTPPLPGQEDFTWVA